MILHVHLKKPARFFLGAGDNEALGASSAYVLRKLCGIRDCLKAVRVAELAESGDRKVACVLRDKEWDNDVSAEAAGLRVRGLAMSWTINGTCGHLDVRESLTKGLKKKIYAARDGELVELLLGILDAKR